MFPFVSVNKFVRYSQHRTLLFEITGFGLTLSLKSKMEHSTGNKAVPQFVVMHLLTRNFALDKVTVKVCNIVPTGSHNGPN
jgi:hypothetical protein